ncbi:MAG TPA: hypothetical protein VLJ83_07290 [Gemmatimonadaceae bacterium]|nr:hypothetical protein [Gemmatimonadaceae bacterium]
MYIIIDRIQAQRLVHRFERFLVSLVRIECAAEQVLCVRQAGIQLDRLLQRAQSTSEIVGVGENRPDRDVRVGKGRVELERLVRGDGGGRD